MKKTYSRRNDITEAICTSERPHFNKQKPQLVASVKSTKAERKAKDWQLELEFKIQYDELLKEKNTYLGNELKAFTELWECYSKTLQGKIEGRTDHESSIYNAQLREAIKEHLLNFEERRYEMATIADTLYNFISYKQKDRESLLDYTCRFKVA